MEHGSQVVVLGAVLVKERQFWPWLVFPTLVLGGAIANRSWPSLRSFRKGASCDSRSAGVHPDKAPLDAYQHVDWQDNVFDPHIFLPACWEFLENGSSHWSELRLRELLHVPSLPRIALRTNDTPARRGLPTLEVEPALRGKRRRQSSSESAAARASEVVPRVKKTAMSSSRLGLRARELLSARAMGRGGIAPLSASRLCLLQANGSPASQSRPKSGTAALTALERGGSESKRQSSPKVEMARKMKHNLHEVAESALSMVVPGASPPSQIVPSAETGNS
jgi:hypothetical protein